MRRRVTDKFTLDKRSSHTLEIARADLYILQVCSVCWDSFCLMWYFILKCLILKISWVFLFFLEWPPTKSWHGSLAARAQNRADVRGGASHLVWTSSLVDMGAKRKWSLLLRASASSVNQTLKVGTESQNAKRCWTRFISATSRSSAALSQAVWRTCRVTISTPAGNVTYMDKGEAVTKRRRPDRWVTDGRRRLSLRIKQHLLPSFEANSCMSLHSAVLAEERSEGKEDI